MLKKSPKKTSSKASGFKYKPRDPEALKRRAEQKGGKFDSPYKQQFNLWKAKGGDNTVRILPPTWDDPEHYGLDIWIHGYIGADNSTYLCLAKMRNKPCPICKAAKEAADAGEKDEAKSLEASRKVLVWIIDREGEEDTPLLWPMSWTQDKEIAALCQNRKTKAWLQIDNEEEGYDVSFRRQGEGLKTRYSAFQIDRDPTPISDDSRTQKEVLEFISDNPLPTILVYHDAKYLEGVLSGQVEAKDEDLEEEDEEEEERKPRKSARRARDEVDDDEDEEDEDEEASDDDDSEEEEDESEEEADEEDEEADEPRRRVAATPKAKKRPNQSTRRRR